MSLLEHAKYELSLIGNGDDFDKHVLDMIEIFANHGHSGFSAGYTISLLNSLLQFKPLKPLTGFEDEWIDLQDGTFQNRRYSAVFKNSLGEARWIEGRVFTDDDGKSWYTNQDSVVTVEFPFTPRESERVYLPTKE
jgi:hypothetical protein